MLFMKKFQIARLIVFFFITLSIISYFPIFLLKAEAKQISLPIQSGDYLKIDYFQGKFSVSQPPIVGKVVDLVFSVSPIEDAPNTKIKLIFPYGVEALNENLTWHVNIKKDEKMQFKVPIRVIKGGEWRIQAYVEWMPSKEFKIKKSYYAYIISNKNEAYISETSKERKVKILQPLPERESWIECPLDSTLKFSFCSFQKGLIYPFLILIFAPATVLGIMAIGSVILFKKGRKKLAIGLGIMFVVFTGIWIILLLSPVPVVPFRVPVPYVP